MEREKEIVGRYLGLCPCGRKIWADSRNFVVMHELPYCKKFDELEPDKFLTYVRRSRGIPDSEVI